MKKQKICVIGDGLAGLTAALSLKTTSTDVDLYCGDNSQVKKKDTRTTAISNSNYEFIVKKIGISNKKLFWQCNKINLYFENKNRHLNFLNFKEKKNLMYIFENKKLKEELIKKIRSQKIKLFRKNVIKININNNYIKAGSKKRYDLYLLCMGAKSSFYEQLTRGRAIKKDYGEISITANIKHNLKINNPSQYFLKEGPLAILPFKKRNFSFVWSVSRKFYEINKKNLQKKIVEKLKEILKSKLFKMSKIQYYPIHLNLQKNYHKKNYLILGEGLHSVHPLAGQGFNLVLRDIIELRKIINNHLDLGFLIKDSLVLDNFYSARKTKNTIFSLGIDMTHSFFRTKLISRSVKSYVLKEFKKFEKLKNITKIISDKGFY